jgi:hypothetical protein
MIEIEKRRGSWRCADSRVWCAGCIAAVLGATVAHAGPNGFNTSFARIEQGDIRHGGPARDGIPALSQPHYVDATDAVFLRPDDRVIGIAMGDDERAYPLRILVWHEVVNDVVGGRAIAITYCPLCDSVLVFDRTVAGETLEFGISGLLYNSNVLLYDRRARTGSESLWCQVEMRAVTGPAAERGLRLPLLPSELVRWDDWQRRHSGTRVLSPRTGYQRAYHGAAYAGYFGSEDLIFPVRKKTERPSRFRDKEPMVVVFTEGRARAYAVRDVVAEAKEGVLADRLGDRRISLVVGSAGDTLRAVAADGGAPPAVAYLFWFALSAMQPDVEIYSPP